MISKFKIVIASIVTGLLLIVFSSCSIYTFSGSSLPSHLKTVDIPLFLNKSLEPDVADEITNELNKQVLSSNLLRIVKERGDASISGEVTSYSNDPYTFGATEVRQVDVNQYKVRIVAEVEFYDNKKGKELYKGSITGEGIYDFKNETEKVGKERAEKDLVQRILENSIQSW
jgi:hypothetical protein